MPLLEQTRFGCQELKSTCVTMSLEHKTVLIHQIIFRLILYSTETHFRKHNCTSMMISEYKRDRLLPGFSRGMIDANI